jgi:ubiquinone/menaquinone biosynthesis C-methylase UbiE
VRKGLPFKSNSIDEVHSSHFVEHLTGQERIHFFNELYRVMKVGATALITTPNWSHACAYGDPTHQWPPMSIWYPLYLNKEWREVNAPHVSYTCDFNHVVAGSWDQSIEGRNETYKQIAMNTQTNAWRDLIVTLTKK